MKHRVGGKILFSAVSLWVIFAPIAYSKSVEQWTPGTELSSAAYYGQKQELISLIESGHDVNQIGGSGLSALMWAVLGAELECAKLLLQAGADVTLETGYYHGTTALEFALGNTSFRYHLEKIPNKGFLDTTVYSEIIRLLLETEPDVRMHTDLSPREALDLAVDGSDADVLHYVLSYDVDVNARGPGDWNPLLRACHAHKTEFARVLIDHGADVNVVIKVPESTYHAYDGYTPLKFAEGNPELIRLLKEAGAKE